MAQIMLKNMRAIGLGSKLLPHRFSHKFQPPTYASSSRTLSTSYRLSSAFFKCDHPLVAGTSFIDDSNVYQMLNHYETILLDCDGVLWGSDHFTHLQGVAKTIEKLRSINKQLLFVTNNSAHDRQHYVDKFRELAAFDANIADVYCTAYSSALYLKDILKIRGKCYMVGSDGMKAELDKLNIKHFGHGLDLDPPSANPDVLREQVLDPEVEAVLVGFDINFNYSKLFKAASYLSNPNCTFVATNDVECSIQIGPLHCQPLTGSLVSAVAAASRREPDVLGKPHFHLMEAIRDTHPNINLSKTLMIGDTLKTDVMFAHNCGISSALVLSGDTSSQRLDKLLALPRNVGEIMPNYVLPSVSFLAEFI